MKSPKHTVNAHSFDIFGFVRTYPKNKAFRLNVSGDVLVYFMGNQTRIQAFLRLPVRYV